MVRAIFLGRIGQPDERAGAACFWRGGSARFKAYPFKSKSE